MWKKMQTMIANSEWLAIGVLGFTFMLIHLHPATFAIKLSEKLKAPLHTVILIWITTVSISVFQLSGSTS